uniref:Uncharacterized protein n=1 Tax=Manihot esculenta TaxID=3983 RepID=A0A2C9VEP5_MANES
MPGSSNMIEIIGLRILRLRRNSMLWRVLGLVFLLLELLFPYHLGVAWFLIEKATLRLLRFYVDNNGVQWLQLYFEFARTVAF